ncbi:Glycosyl transferase family 2 [Tistlia consotensis]|uniref:Glycosyl transferase family 2 n=1 Tax=Tistlia consotensis USBA 355 TaxID=560819 RepID=A0A1Y6CH75_9PROT|nr:glycosyltransferase family 2 protein [Tistlia consotensis]SMF55643.1 Glycosyl transferase family 2 [Tistlia consotensis USBA 355]SNR88889.1 Glycosyl transferase family 2 [Tistlia consotensis]
MTGPKAKPSVTLFVPVRNEIDALKIVMPRIKRDWCDEILILDGNSTDGSREFLRSAGFEVVEQQTRGIKAAFWEAFELARGEVIIPFSPDGNSIPEDIPRLIDKMADGYDIVVASRYRGPARSEDDDVLSRAANRIFTALINLLFDTRYTDGIGMYKAFRKSHLYELGIDRHRNEHSEIMLLTRGARYGLKITEISSPEPPRIGVQGSRAHPGVLGKYKSALILLKSIVRDAVFYWPRRTRSARNPTP